VISPDLEGSLIRLALSTQAAGRKGAQLCLKCMDTRCSCAGGGGAAAGRVSKHSHRPAALCTACYDVPCSCPGGGSR
jgi:hypothetical protein